MDKELEILKKLSKYLQLKIDNGEHKIIYNDLMWDEKTIDCINAIETLVQIADNSISREVIEKKLTELKKEYKEALETNSTKAFILKCQIEILQELLKKEKEVE